MSYEHQFNENLSELGIKLAWELFGLELNIPICDAQFKGSRGLTTLGSFVLKRHYGENGRIIKKTPLHILINSVVGMSKEEKEDTLKHELCHWACFVRGKAYKDGSKFFEQELLRIGANSSGFDSLQDSKNHQQAIASGLDGRMGSKFFSYEPIKTSSNGNRYLTVKYAGCKIGVIKKKPKGSFPWVNVTDDSALFAYGYKTRRDCAKQLKEEWDKGKKIALDSVWEDFKHLLKGEN